ncbi:VOC family protein [Chitinolyticbacter albus]|uniref:VOC family protein n=1 Tax=Chitinolyticbacter albus TaxID=2961951 RepID=UPI00210B18C0|nr:VOC family protein [Chitinolyticbacter albus]
MNHDNPSIMSHVSLGTNRFAEAAAFYDAVLATVGARRVLDFPGAIAYGKAYPEFWVQTPYDGQRAAAGNGTHFGFFAASPAEVDAFYTAALAHGASGDGAPGPREEYGAPYYGCFVRDLDGHKIEAAYWDSELAAKLEL